MRMMRLFSAIIISAALGLSGSTALGAAPAKKSAKGSTNNPTARPASSVQDVPGLPRVLIIGDSISIGYTVPVRELLKGKANVHRPGTNCGPSSRGVENLDKWLGTNHWDVIHFNFGLHDLKYVDDQGKNTTPDVGKQMVPLPAYERNLQTIVARLKQTGARLIWCTTTPVPADSPSRIKDAELEYNRVAAKVMKGNGISIDDLHAFVVPRQAEIQLPQNVHYTKPGYQALAGQVAKSIEAHLK